MTNKTFRLYIVCLFTFMLFACIGGNVADDIVLKTPTSVIDSTTEPVVSVATNEPKISNTITSTPPATSTLTPTENPSPMPTSLPTSVPPPEIRCEVPLSVSREETSLLKTGTILVRPFQEGGVWALSKNALEPYQIVSSPGSPELSPYLSHDKTKILLTQHGEKIVIFDLVTEETMEFPWEDSWLGPRREWTFDGRVEIMINLERRPGEGWINYESVLLDPITLEKETVMQDILLPEFTFHDKNPYIGFASFNSDETLVLYTAYNQEKGTNDYVLKDIESNIELWRYEDISIGPGPVPSWSTDGQKIVMAIIPSDSEPDVGSIKLASLTLDGFVFEILTDLPSFLPDYAFIRQVSWSPDSSYVLFGLWETIQNGPEYILNTQNGTIQQICDPGYYDGWWLQETNQVLYLVKNAEGIELKLLDIDNWQSQLLWQMGDVPNPQLSIIGWTPVEFPESGSD